MSSADPHGQCTLGTEFCKRKKVVYTIEHSPSHFKRPAYYLKQLRDCGDYRSCDIEFVTNTGSVKVHSAIAAAHCRRVAKLLELHNTPLRVDMRRFQSELVLKMVEWMYNGQVEIVWEHMAEHMVVANYLGDAFLHHQLENTLKCVTNEAKTRIEAVNVASHPNTGVSSETVAEILDALNDTCGAFSMEEIMLLQPWAIRTLVATPANTPKKISFLNIALNWLRSLQNISWLDIIINSIYIENMSSRELIAFRRTLRAILLNPSTRRLVTVSADKGATIAINMDKLHEDHTEVFTQRLEKKAEWPNSIAKKENLFYPLLRHEQDREHSTCDVSIRLQYPLFLSELPSYTNLKSQMCRPIGVEGSRNSLNSSEHRHAGQVSSVSSTSTKNMQKIPRENQFVRSSTSNAAPDNSRKLSQKMSREVIRKSCSRVYYKKILKLCYFVCSGDGGKKRQNMLCHIMLSEYTWTMCVMNF
ncbi:BTB/POZ domain protein [Dictyocaulus viviparus]|uniref:BTB/POZ domain protein n=1 Tax=Dictyocaulus viviparus TaxID=29172 RepID=A0A0D8Y122_DICVI|nr:BTB/POZ domain protein [Dictyocaulus viviparus]